MRLYRKKISRAKAQLELCLSALKTIKNGYKGNIVTKNEEMVKWLRW